LVEESLRIQMSSISFGIGANAKSLKKKQKMQTLAEFAEPTDDHPAAFEFLSEQQREDEANALQEEGNKRAEASEYSAAVRLWDRALLYAPKRAVLHELKSQVLLEVGQAWEAVQSASRAMELQPDWPDALLTLARAQLAFGEPEEALQQMEKVLTLQPGHPEAAEEVASIRMLVLQRKQDPQSAGQRLRVV